jgi:hypothetical protein
VGGCDVGGPGGQVRELLHTTQHPFFFISGYLT